MTQSLITNVRGDIELRYFDGCPNWRTTDKRLKAALAELGDRTEIRYREVENYEQAEELGFIGSPTLIIRGEDPFAQQGAPVGFACRVYQTEEGPAGSPTVDQIIEAVTNTT